jgi:hypothetical protein
VGEKDLEDFDQADNQRPHAGERRSIGVGLPAAAHHESGIFEALLSHTRFAASIRLANSAAT